MPNKEFLESHPLYKKFKTSWKFNPNYEHTRIPLKNIPKPAIHMFCEVCHSEQTFNMSNSYFSGAFEQNNPIHGEVKEIRYICSSCQKGLRIFLVYFGHTDTKDKNGYLEIVIQKVGQIPAWSIEMDKELEKLLGTHADYYKRGLINESQGYGIGAHAYFRRITEDIIDDLLDLIYDLIEPAEKEKYKTVLDQTKLTRVTQEKIDLVKDLLPDSLKPDGVNPLGVLHSALSEGLHELSDEECMEQAELIRNSLVFLINQIIKTRTATKSFTESMKKLLGKKSEKVKDK
jgi:hypothetical protein